MILKYIVLAYYWVFIGWWLEPIKYFRKRKIRKMEEELIKANYEKLQQEKKEEF